MKTKLLSLQRKDLEQMFFYFFNTCSLCRDFIEYVPKKELVYMIIKECDKNEIKQTLDEYGLI